jgi:hypothetical protein
MAPCRARVPRYAGSGCQSMIRVFTGYDQREAIGWHVFVHSLLRHASKPVSVHRVDNCGLQQGTNAFTFSRFLVPWLAGFQGRAIFADAADMLCQADIAELDALFDPTKAVQVVQHQYLTRNRRKYLGTAMEADNLDYARKNWASLMCINCEHPGWRWSSPGSIECMRPLAMLQFQFLRDDEIGALPAAWNALADESQPIEGAKILHWTAGIPAFPHYADAPGADIWRAERARMESP